MGMFEILPRMAVSLFPRSVNCTGQMEDTFGPRADTACWNGFDFTLLFEETTMSLTVSAFLLLAMTPRILFLYSEPRKVLAGALHTAKLLAWAGLACANFVLLVTWLSPDSPRTRATDVAAGLTCICSAAACYLSHLEHIRSVRPSKLLEMYLFFSAIFDLARARTLWGIANNNTEAVLFTSTLGLRVLVLALEAAPKTRSLRLLFQNTSPEASAGMFSRGLFWWLNPQLIKGNSTVMKISDLSAIDAKLTGEKSSGADLQARWVKAAKAGKKNPLVSASMHQYKWELAEGIIPRALQIGFLFAQPFLINRTVILMTEPDTPGAQFAGYGLIAAFGIVYTGIAISSVVARHKAFRVITMMRDSIVTMIYNKSIDLPSTGLEGNGPVTLMSADIERLASGLRYIHDLWASVIEMILALWLLYEQLGPAGIAPIAIAVICAMFAIGLSALSRTRQKLWLEAIEIRVEGTAKMLASMKGVKMLGLTDKLFDIIRAMKEDEIYKSKKFRELLIGAAAVAFSNGAIAPVISFAIYSLSGTGVLTTNKAFYSLTLFALLNEPIGTLVESATGLATAISSLERIDVFLLKDPHEDGREVGEPTYETEKSIRKIPFRQSSGDSDGVVVARHRNAGWDTESEPILHDLNVNIRPSTFTVIVGPTGSGKSTFLNTLLGEVPQYDGYLYISTSDVAYCAQTPWLTNSTMKQNILGESPFDLNWYTIVVRACGLEPDIQRLPSGDQSMLGSGGSTLSGGQKQRVALARAVYSQKKTVILDDPISGLDPVTEEMVISNLFGSEGLFKRMETTVIMATNAVQRLAIADHIIVLSSEGSIAQQGSFQELNSREGYVRSLALQSRTLMAPSKDGAATGPIKLPEDAIAPMPATAGDRRTGDMSLHWYYIKTVGIGHSIFFVCLMVVYVFFLSFPAIWVQWWAAANDIKPNQHLGTFLGVYAFLAVAAIGSILGAAWHLMANIVSRAARELHTKLLTTVLNAPTSYFTTNDLGETTNRFTQDLQLIDMELPLSLLNTVLSALICFAQLIIIAYSTRYLVVIIPFALAVFYYIQRFYLRTSRQLRFMDIEIKSPLFSNFLETISGIATIRAFGWKAGFQKRNEELVKTSQVPFYLLFCIQRWLELVVSLAVAGIAVLLVGVAVALIGNLNAGFIGVALVNIVTFSNNVQQLIMHWTIMETSLGAVSRIRSFTTETETENLPGERDVPPESWPSMGKIEFKNVVASYNADGSNPCLKNVTFSIPGGCKVGVCGRSGSGKSSLVSTLLRMLDLQDGSISIDHVDLSTLPRQLIRSNMVVIPQEPYFFTGSVRENLDPFHEHSQNEIIEALRKTQVWDTIEKHGGLDEPITDDLLSHGQRQLLCLSGAMLREGRKILILDEATSGVDRESDELMQKLIRSEFSQHTIIAVAHRLDTILDFDQVIVMDSGNIAEAGNPKELLATESRTGIMSQFGLLYESMDQSGAAAKLAEPKTPVNPRRRSTRASSVYPQSAASVARRVSVPQSPFSPHTILHSATTSRMSRRMSSNLATPSRMSNGSWLANDETDPSRLDRWSGLWQDLWI